MPPKIKFPFSFFLILMFGTSCSYFAGEDSSATIEPCGPQEYFPIDSDVIESFALVTCNGQTSDTYNIFSANSIIVVPQGGTHIMYIRFRPEWALPENIPTIATNNSAEVEIFAGSCALDPPLAVCLPEYTSLGEPLEANRLTSQISRFNNRTLRIEYSLPDTPRQISINLNYCTLWPPDPRYCTGNAEEGSAAMIGYTFRYESIAHITADTQDPNAECDCNK